MENNDILQKLNKNIKEQIPVKLNDGFGTIIYINKGENKEKAIKKYLKDLEEYKTSSVTNFSQGNSKLYKQHNNHNLNNQ